MEVTVSRYAPVPFIRNCTHSLLWQTRKEKGKKKKERQTEERKKNATPSTDYIQYSGREVGEVRGVERGKVNRQRVLPGPTFR